ncbi:MAG: hypothetical protein JW956_13025, partial [Calditrichaceae bacterium]|nr:hypothetical protein [Calditrichaceae bacterium]
MKFWYKIICILMVIIFSACGPRKILKEQIRKPDFKDYISCFFMGEPGTLPTGCEINKVEILNDSVLVCGEAFDKDTKESFNTDIWIGSFIEKTNESGKKDLMPSKRKFLSTTDSSGIFCIKIKVHKNEVLLMDQINYDPAVFEVY